MNFRKRAEPGQVKPDGSGNEASGGAAARVSVAASTPAEVHSKHTGGVLVDLDDHANPANVEHASDHMSGCSASAGSRFLRSGEQTRGSEETWANFRSFNRIIDRGGGESSSLQRQNPEFPAATREIDCSLAAP